MRQINEVGIDLIKRFEGLRLQAYRDSVGVLTIGYGHTGPDVSEGQAITQTQADALLRQDVGSAEEAVGRLVTVPITDNQFAALVSFVFNLGAGSLQDSTLLHLLNAGDYAGAADQFLRWVHAGPSVLPGLVARRAAERALFRTPEPPAKAA